MYKTKWSEKLETWVVLCIWNVFIDCLKFPCRTINRKSLHENISYSSQISIGLLSLSLLKLNEEELKWQNSRTCKCCSPFIFLYKEEWWNNIYFSGPFSIFLARLFCSWNGTLIVSILLLNYQHKATYLKDSIYSVITLKSTRRQNPLIYVSFFRASLFVLCFLLESDSVLIRKASRVHY